MEIEADDPPSTWARVMAILFAAYALVVPLAQAIISGTWHRDMCFFVPCFGVWSAIGLGVTFSRRRLARVFVRFDGDGVEWRELYTLSEYDSAGSVFWRDVDVMYTTADLPNLVTFQKTDGTAVSAWLCPCDYQQDFDRARRMFAPSVRANL